MCKRIVQQGVNLEAGYQDCYGCTPLLYSLRLQQPAIAEYLVLEGAAPGGIICHNFNPEGHSVFHIATKFNYLELLRILLERHPNQYLHLTDAIHPFHVTIFYYATKCISLLISHAAKGRSLSMAHEFSMRLTSLTEGTSTSAASPQYAQGYACHLANLRVGISDSILDPLILSNDTSFILAIKVPNHEIVRLVLEAGGLIDEGDLNHGTPLHHAASLGDGEIVELLLKRGANPQVRDRWLRTPAMLAFSGGHLQALQALSRGGADLQILDMVGANALYYAVRGERTDALLYLMATMSGYDLAQKDLRGKSVLNLAFGLGGHDLQVLLLNLAPSPRAYCPGEFNIWTNTMENTSMTAGVMRMLLRRVPQELLPTLLTHRTRFRGTPLYAACSQLSMPLQSAIISLLLDVGAELDTEGGDYGTPLMGACVSGRLQAVKLLVWKGAKILYRNEHGQTFSALRAAKHFPEIVRWLLVGRHIGGPGLLTHGGIE